MPKQNDIRELIQLLRSGGYTIHPLTACKGEGCLRIVVYLDNPLSVAVSFTYFVDGYFTLKLNSQRASSSRDCVGYLSAYKLAEEELLIAYDNFKRKFIQLVMVENKLALLLRWCAWTVRHDLMCNALLAWLDSGLTPSTNTDIYSNIDSNISKNERLIQAANSDYSRAYDWVQHIARSPHARGNRNPARLWVDEGEECGLLFSKLRSLQCRQEDLLAARKSTDIACEALYWDQSTMTGFYSVQRAVASMHTARGYAKPWWLRYRQMQRSLGLAEVEDGEDLTIWCTSLLKADKEWLGKQYG